MKKILVCVLLLAICFCLSASVALAEEEVVAEETAGVKDWLAQYVNKETITNFINWLIDGGIGIGLITTLAKYYKERKSTKDMVTDVVKDVVQKLWADKDDKDKQEILEDLKTVKESNDTIVKALIMAQDSTSKGKIALLDLLNVAKTADVQKVVETTKQAIEDKIKEDDGVKQAVQEVYQNIF